jgi:5-methylthioadenosine/S-adenosylhomocysteine deaminase
MTAPRSVDLLILGATVVSMDDAWTLIPDGGIAILGTDIVAVGPASEMGLRYRANARQVLDGSGCLMLPGLINMHTHGADSLFRGLIDDLPLEPWLERLWEVEKQVLNPQTVEAGARLAYAEMIRGGTTTALDMFWYPEASAKAAREAGFRLLTGPTWFDSTEIDGMTPADRRHRAPEFLQEYRHDPLITPCVLAHATYTVAPPHLADAREVADEFDALFSTHCSETAAEVEQVQGSYGKRPPALLDSLELLGPRTVLAHCVHLERQEVDLLADRRVVVAHCPLSNLKLGSGVAPFAGMRRAGVRLGLGTDGPVSGNDLDMWWTMRLAAVLHKGVHQDPALISAREIVALATRGAAAALGKGDEIGALEPGKKADLILIDLDRTHLTPLFDVYSHLVYAVGRSDVVTTLINGQVVMRDRRLTTLDESAAIAEVNQIAARIAT